MKENNDSQGLGIGCAFLLVMLAIAYAVGKWAYIGFPGLAR